MEGILPGRTQEPAGLSAQTGVAMAFDAVHLFPVRHHSPRAARALRALLEQVRPSHVLVEAPADAEALLPLLTDPDSEPPIAILGYCTEGEPRSALWPFAHYSPEWVALRWAREHGAVARLIDWPTGVALAADAEDEAAATCRAAQPEGASAGEAVAAVDAANAVDAEDPVTLDTGAALAARFGARSFEEFWEAWFEAPEYTPARFAAALDAYAEHLAAATLTRDRRSAQRDAYMAAAIDAELAQGVAPERMVVVLGAAHVAALRRGRYDIALHAHAPAALPGALALVPYSYSRLSEQSGYGAGNRAPYFYERVHQAGVDFTRATLEALLAFAEDLRLRGYAVSLADSIEAYRLALALTALREKSAPGLDEVREAAQATLTRGERAPIEAYLLPQLIGKRIGRLARSAGRNTLQQEFWAALDHYRLPRVDEAETVSLRLTDPIHAAASVFLHRLRVANVPYAVFLGSQQVSTRARAGSEAPGGFGALSRVREHWETQWTPATDIALIEAIVYGERLVQVCERRIGQALESVTAAGAASALLVDAVLTEASEGSARALDTLERSSLLDEDLASLATAARTLSGLAAYGTSRPALAQAGPTIERLLRATYTRALLRLDQACRGTAEATESARQALRTLHELALSSTLIEREAWFAAAARLSADDGIEPTAAGVATALLHLARVLDDAQLVTLLERRVGDIVEPAHAAAFLQGFLEVNALVLVKNRAIVAALDRFMGTLSAEQFRAALPALRKALAVLGASERRFLVEHLVSLHAPAQTAAPAVLAAPDADALKALGGSIAQALDDLDDLL